MFPLTLMAFKVPTSTSCVVLVAVPVKAPESVAVAETLQMEEVHVGAEESVASAVYQSWNPQSYSAVVSEAPQVLPVVVATHELAA